MNKLDLLVLKKTTVIMGTLGAQLAETDMTASQQIFDLVKELGRIIGENEKSNNPKVQKPTEEV